MGADKITGFDKPIQSAGAGILRIADLAVVLVVGLLVTGLAAWFIQSAEYRRVNDVFLLDASMRFQAIYRQVDTQQRDLQFFQQLLRQVPATPTDEFTQLVKPFLGNTLAIGWVSPILGALRGGVEQQLSESVQRNIVITEITDDGLLRPALSRGLHFPLLFGLTDQSISLPIGLDMLYEEQRRQALLRAIEARGVAVTTPLRLVLNGSQGLSGVVMFAPVFGGTAQDPESGFSLSGLVISSISFERLLLESARDGEHELAISLYHRDDAPDGAPPVFAGLLAPASDVSMAFSASLPIADDSYTLFIHPSAAYLDRRLGRPWATTTLVGVLLTVLVAFYIFTVKNQRQLALRLVDARTRELRHSEQRLSFALDGAREGVWDWNIETDHVYYSGRWKSHLGMDDSSSGNPISTWTKRIHPDDVDQFHAALARHFRGETPVYSYEYRISSQLDDSWKWVLDRGVVVDWDADGKPRRAIGTHADISQRKQMEIDIRRANAYLEALLNSATQVSIIATDPNGQITIFNPGAERMTGYSRDDLFCKATPAQLHDPDELAARWGELVDAGKNVQQGFDVVVHSAAKGESEEREWTYICKDGSRLTVDLITTAILAADGDCIGFLAVAIDVTTRRATERALQERDALFAKLTALVPGMIYQIERRADGRLFFPYTSEGVRSVYELSPEAVGKDADAVFDRVHPEDAREVLASIVQSSETLDLWQQDYRVMLPGRGLCWHRAEAQPERLEGGKTLWHGYVTDISRQKAIEEELHRLSVTDQLTGLSNRRSLLKRMGEEMARLKRYGQPVSLVMLDLDHFKAINDHYGHAMGDAVLVFVSGLLRQRTRSTDVCARWGGEEFMLLCPSSTLSEVTLLAEDLCRSLVAADSPLERQVSGSFGVVEIRVDDTEESLLQRIDKLLYEAKSAGRNCVRVERPETSFS